MAFRPRLSAGLALSAESEHTPTVLNTRIYRRMRSSERPLSAADQAVSGQVLRLRVLDEPCSLNFHLNPVLFDEDYFHQE